MKRLIRFALLLVLFTAVTAGAATITLAWNANTEANIAGYRIYYGTASRIYTVTNLTTTGTQIVVPNLATSGRYYFAVTAFNTFGVESDLSAEVIGFTPVTPPANFRTITNSLQGAASPTGPWQNLATYTMDVPTDQQHQYFRAAVGIGNSNIVASASPRTLMLRIP